MRAKITGKRQQPEFRSDEMECPVRPHGVDKAMDDSTQLAEFWRSFHDVN